MATKRRYPKRRILKRNTAKRMSRMVKRGGALKCPKCGSYDTKSVGTEQTAYGPKNMCMCNSCGHRFWCAQSR